MVKSELIQKLAERGNISKTLAETVVNLIFSGMIQELVEKKPIEIRGFGSFRVRSYKDIKEGTRVPEQKLTWIRKSSRFSELGKSYEFV